MVVIVMGVSGSGKTSVGQALAHRLGWAFEDADDWHPAANVEKMRNGIALTDADRAPWIESLANAIAGWVSCGRNAVLACSALRRWHRDSLRAGVADPEAVRFVYLKGAYETIDQRLRMRTTHFMPESLLQSQFATLEEPDSSEALTVDVCLPVAAIVDEIVSKLHLKAPDVGAPRAQSSEAG
jgi:gluconokinase